MKMEMVLGILMSWTTQISLVDRYVSGSKRVTIIVYRSPRGS
jgi:hypothetical protein